MDNIRPSIYRSKCQTMSLLVVMVIAWTFYPCEVTSRLENKWYNIGPQSNQTINTVITIANITPPTNGLIQLQTDTPEVNPINPSSQPVQPAQPTTPAQPVQPTTQAQPTQPVNPAQGQTTNKKPVQPAQPSPAGTSIPITPEMKKTRQPLTMSDIKSVGCFLDSYINPRPLPKLIADFRDDIENATKNHNYNDTILACGKKADEMGFKFYGIQSNGECWSGKDSEKTYSRDGKSTDCHDGVGNSGSNYVYRFVGEHAKPCKDCGPARKMICFPANAKLKLDNGIVTSMIDLKVGDKVQTIDPSTNQIILTDVIAFLHKESTEGLYRVVEVEDGEQIVLSARHLIFSAKTNQTEALSIVYAEDIISGDFVWVSGRENPLERVSSVYTTKGNGVYAPMTRHGTMLVDGVLVSCYAHWRSHDIAHKVMAPLRVWFDITSILGDMLSSVGKKIPMANSSPDGIHWYASLLMYLSHSLPSSLANYVGM